MKQINSFLLQSTLLLLLSFTSVAGDSFFLLSADATESIELISTESSLENIDELASGNDLEGSDDDSNTDNVFTQPSPVVFYPLVITAGQLSSRPLSISVPFYILYQRLIFYHTVA